MLALWTMTIPAGVIAVTLLFTIWTAIDLSAESLGPATLNGTHHLALAVSQVFCILLAISIPVFSKDVRQF
jgi:hypothetical protein